MIAFATSLAFLLIHALGLVLICAALFMYEDEEGNFQNKVEEWWIKLRDKETVSQSRAKTFMQAVASLTNKGFDRLFGSSLFSVRVIPISIYLSCASFFLFTFFAFPFVKNTNGVARYGAFLWFLFFFLLSLMPALVSNRFIRAVWWSIIPATLLSISGFVIFVFKTRGAHAALRGIGLIILIFASSLMADLIYIAFTRHTLRKAAGIDHIGTIAWMVLGNLLLLALLVVGPIYIGVAISKYAPMAGGMVLFSFPLNSVDLIVGFAALCVALLLLIHRLFWPAIQRPIYSICRFAPIKEKKWLFTVGCALLFLPRHLTMETIKAVLDKL